MKVEVKGVSFSHLKNKLALQNVCFSVEHGDIFGLLGRNGSGKSTLISLIAGVLKLQSGEIRFDFESLNSGQFDPRWNIGVVFQNNSLDQKLTCLQNLRLAAMLYKIRGIAAEKRIAECLELAELTPFARDDVSSLSGGMKRRLDLVRAMVHQPALLLMDEPTVGLDEVSFRQIWKTLEALRSSRNVTIILSTHRPEEAERCNRVAFFHEGKITDLDSPKRLREGLERDVIVLRTEHMQVVFNHIAKTFPQPVRLEGQEILVQSTAGHLLIPKIVEAFEPGILTSVALRQVSMADVFLDRTGTVL